MIEHPQTPITYEWLLENGFFELPRIDRKTTLTCRRLLGGEILGERFMVSACDLCIDVAATDATATRWFVWICKALSNKSRATEHIHVRHMRQIGELILLYEGLTGRWFAPSVAVADRGGPIFAE